MKIRLTSTSFLPPKNISWLSLQKSNSLIFGEYADWPQVLTNNEDSEILSWTIFLEDLIPKKLYFTYSDNDKKEAIEIIDSVLDVLRLKLKQNFTQKIIISWLGFHGNSVIRYSKETTAIHFANQYLEVKLREITNQNNKVYLIPLDIFFGQDGYKNCLDYRNYFLTRIRLSSKGIKKLAELIDETIQRINFPQSKLLILDCDNTLWGGVVGEVGLNNILLGQDGIGIAFSTFQETIKELSNNGLLLAISSKNDEKDVIKVLELHNGMHLKMDSFLIKKIDWRDKSIHIREIANELNIGLDSIVFWDDNPIEREKVKHSLPSVLVIEPPLDIVDWAQYLKKLLCFSSFSFTKEDKNKVQQYKAKAEFVSETTKYSNYNDFLSSINMKANILHINDSNLGRAVQLCQKTNQLNLRLQRHDENKIKEFIGIEKSVLFMIELNDKFGDHGIISFVIVTPTSNLKIAFLDTFLMSCRVLGRNLESYIFDILKSKLLEHGYEELLSEFILGERNSSAESILINNNFIKLNNSNDKVANYRVKLKNWDIPNLDIFK